MTEDATTNADLTRGLFFTSGGPGGTFLHLGVDWREHAKRLCRWEDGAQARRDMIALRQACMHRARSTLRSFSLHESDVEDLVHDFLATHLDELARDDLTSPETFFVACLRNAARDKVRNEKRRRELLAGELEQDAHEAPAPDVFARERLERAFAALPEHHRAIFLAAIGGDDREALGRAFGTSRANVDQIVRRTRLHLTRAVGEGEDS